MFSSKSHHGPTGSGNIPSIHSQKLDIKFGPPRTAPTMKMLASRSGFMIKRNEQGKMQNRFVALVPHTFLYYYDNEHSTEPKGIIDIENYEDIRIEEINRGEPMIKVSSENSQARSFYFKTDTTEETSDWISALKNNRYFTIEKQRDEYHRITTQVSPHVKEQADTIQLLNNENYEQNTRRRHSLSSIKKWMTEIAVAQTDIDSIEDIEDGIKLLKEKINNKKTESELFKQEGSMASKQDEEYKLLIAEINRSKNVIKKLENENEMMKKSLEKSKAEKEDDIDSFKQDIKIYEAKIQSIEQESNNLRVEKKKLVSAYKDLSKAKDVIKKENKKLNVALQVIQQKVKTLEEQKATLDETISVLQDENHRYSDSAGENASHSSNPGDQFHSKRHSSIIFDLASSNGEANVQSETTGALFDSLSPKSHNEEDGDETFNQNIDILDNVSVVSNGYYSVAPGIQNGSPITSPKSDEPQKQQKSSFFGKVLNMLTDVDQIDDLLFPQPVIVMPEDAYSYHRGQNEKYIPPEPIFGSSVSSVRSPRFAGSATSYQNISNKEVDNNASSTNNNPVDNKVTDNISPRSPLQYQQRKPKQSQHSHYSINPEIPISPFLDQTNINQQNVDEHNMYCIICGGIAAGPRHSTCKCANPSLQDRPLTQKQLDSIKSGEATKRKSGRKSLLQTFLGTGGDTNGNRNVSEEKGMTSLTENQISNKNTSDPLMNSGTSLNDVTAFDADDVSVLTQDMTLMTGQVDHSKEDMDKKNQNGESIEIMDKIKGKETEESVDAIDMPDDASGVSRKISVTEIDFNDIHKASDEEDDITRPVPEDSRQDSSGDVKKNFEVQVEEPANKKSTRLSINPLSPVNKHLDGGLYTESNTHLYRGSSMVISKPNHDVKHFNGSGATDLSSINESVTTKVDTTEEDPSLIDNGKIKSVEISVEKEENRNGSNTPSHNKIGNSSTDFFNPVAFDDKAIDLPEGPPSEVTSTPKRKSQRKSVMKRISSIRKSLSPVGSKTSPNAKVNSAIAAQKMQKQTGTTIHVSTACDTFTPNPFKNTVCKTCQHLEADHQRI